MSVTKLQLKELPVIELGSSTWIAIEQWVRAELVVWRMKREEFDADQRKLDVALGTIKALEQVLALPAAIKKDRIREPIVDGDFGIPSPKGF